MVIKTQANLIEKTELSPTTMLFKFCCEDEFQFNAGQFVNFIINKEDASRPLRRAYSISSAFDTSKPREFELCIKLEEEGEFTPILFNSQIGEKYDIMGPLGLFKLHSYDKEGEDEQQHQVFIGAGSGIAPLRSFIRELLINQKFDKTVTLLYGARSEDEILFKDEFEELEKNYTNFNYIVTLSNPSSSWSDLKGYVQDHLDLVDNLQESEIYICGRTKMVDSVHEKLDILGVSVQQRHHEKFG